MPRDSQPHSLFLRQNQLPPEGVFVFRLTLGCVHDVLPRCLITLLLREERRREERIATPAPSRCMYLLQVGACSPAPSRCMLTPRQPAQDCHPRASSAAAVDPNQPGGGKVS